MPVAGRAVVSRPPELVPVVTARALRGFADGLASVLLAGFLTALGFSPLQVGAVVTGTLLGSAALTLGTGLRSRRWPLRTLLLAACALMFATGLGFAAATTFAFVLVVAVLGTLNPSGGDVSVFLPTEQALLADALPAAERPHAYARYNLAGSVGAAVGALASGGFEPLGDAAGWATATADRVGFLVYAGIAVLAAALYRRLPRTAHVPAPPPGERRPALGRSRRTVLELAALFSLDSAAGGFVVQSLLVLWLQLRFDLSPGVTGAVFFAAGLLAAASQLLAPVLARRVGLVRTMVFTHFPANVLLCVAAFAPTAGVAVTLLLLRSLLSQMDVPARQSLVMAVVPPEERAAAASVTNVPRSLASAATPLLAGALLSRSSVGWPLLIAGLAKATYDLLLLALFRNLPEQEGATRARARRPPSS
jgi:predicted MFS family arabinose efflux permease